MLCIYMYTQKDGQSNVSEEHRVGVRRSFEVGLLQFTGHILANKKKVMKSKKEDS